MSNPTLTVPRIRGGGCQSGVNLDDQKMPSFKGFTPLRYLPWWRCVASFIGYVTRRDEKMFGPLSGCLCLGDQCVSARVTLSSVWPVPNRATRSQPLGLGSHRVATSEGPDTRPGCVTMKLSSLDGSARRAATPWASVFVAHVVPSGTPVGVAWRGTSWPRACTAKGGMSTRRTLNCVVAQTDYQESCVRGAVYRDGPPSQRPPRRPLK